MPSSGGETDSHNLLQLARLPEILLEEVCVSGVLQEILICVRLGSPSARQSIPKALSIQVFLKFKEG